MGPGRLAEQLSLHGGDPRALGAVNYANIGKCVEQRTPRGLKMLCVVPCLLSQAGRKQAAETRGAGAGCRCGCVWPRMLDTGLIAHR